MRLVWLFYILSSIAPLKACIGLQQNNIFLKKFDSVFYSEVESKNVFNYKRYLRYSKSQDANKFMALSYGVNALNIMYKATSSMKYLKANKEIIDNIIYYAKPIPLNWEKNNDDGKAMGYSGWLVKTNTSKQIIGKDWKLYEGYLFRYIAQYLFLLKENDIMKKHPEFDTHFYKVLSFIEKHVWDKWEKRSILKNKNLSSFYASRTHMGSHWAVIALYLSEISENKSKLETYAYVTDTYNALLRNNFQIKSHENSEYYVWHSTYDMLPNNSELNKVVQVSKKSIWQDVSHGNQVVDYLITSFELEKPEWNKNDINRLINTVKYLTWEPKTRKFKDIFQGKGKEPELTDIGWKQSDGWLKLSRYDYALFEIYKSFYYENKNKIDRSFLSTQYWAQLAFLSQMNKNEK